MGLTFGFRHQGLFMAKCKSMSRPEDAEYTVRLWRVERGAALGSKRGGHEVVSPLGVRPTLGGKTLCRIPDASLPLLAVVASTTPLRGGR